MPKRRVERRTELSVLEVARLVNVSRARVYQRIDGHVHSKPLASRQYHTSRVPGGINKRVPVEDALAWRAERLAAGELVGPLPDWLAIQLGVPIAPVRVLEPDPVPDPEPPVPVGLPVFRPF